MGLKHWTRTYDAATTNENLLLSPDGVIESPPEWVQLIEAIGTEVVLEDWNGDEVTLTKTANTEVWAGRFRKLVSATGDVTMGTGTAPTTIASGTGPVAAQLPASLGKKAASASLSVAGASGTNVHSSAFEASKVIFSGAGVLRSIKATNKSADTDAWLMLFDATSLPANSAIPARAPIPVPFGSVNGDVWEGGTAFATGCVAALSSTVASLTVIVAADGFFDAEKD